MKGSHVTWQWYSIHLKGKSTKLPLKNMAVVNPIQQPHIGGHSPAPSSH